MNHYSFVLVETCLGWKPKMFFQEEKHTVLPTQVHPLVLMHHSGQNKPCRLYYVILTSEEAEHQSIPDQKKTLFH